MRSNNYNRLLVVGLIVVLGGCRFSSSSNHQPGYLVVGIESNPLQLDPRYSTDANSVRIGGLIYNSLLRSDENSRLQLELAENWQRMDPQTYIFDLRRNITFHNGQPLTAADVKFTYESILQAKNLSPKRALLKPLQAIDQLGPYRLRFRLAAPHAPFLEHFTIGIVPASSAGDAVSSAAPPVGSGPFMLESLQSGETVTLKANPSYWEGKPSIAGLVFKVVPDAMVRVLEFKKGSIDFMQNDLEPDVLPWIKDNTDAAIEARQGTTFQYIGINLTHPILKQKKVRQALAHAIDRESIIRHLIKDLGTPASGLLSPLNWAYEGTVNAMASRSGEGKTTCWMRLDFVIPTVTGRGLDSSSLLKAPISICEEEWPKLSKNSCNASASTWRSAPTNGALSSATLRRATFISILLPGWAFRIRISIIRSFIPPASRLTAITGGITAMHK